MFAITGGRGFHMTFGNRWAISVQFGPMTYSEHHDDMEYDRPIKAITESRSRRWESATAEIAVISPAGDLIQLDHDSVQGWQDSDAVALLIGAVSKLPRDHDPEQGIGVVWRPDGKPVLVGADGMAEMYPEDNE